MVCGGCNREAAQPLTADAFIAKRVEGRADPEPIDTPGQVIVGGVKPPLETGEAPENEQSVRAISPTVQNAVRQPAHQVNTTPPTKTAARTSTSPATSQAAVDPSGQYVILGTVLANVNTRPIYAHKLLSVLDSALRAEAQRSDEQQFRAAAADLIEKELRSQVREEVVYAVAEKSLDAREREFAEMLTAQWKSQEVTKAGGSLEIAKRRWADEGWDAQDRLDYQYRLSMNQIFYQRRVFPLVHVTARELRDYYEKNKDKEFTKPERVKFRVIRIDPKSMKVSLDEARVLAERTHESALKGDFESVARETNDPALKSTGGIVPGSDKGYLPRGTYVSDKLEDAVWSLQPGGITNVIEDRNAFYFAKLEDHQAGAAVEFEDLGVQEKIRETLLAEQYRKLQDQFQEKLIKESVIQEHPQMRQIALDMAMQRYRAWTSTARSTP